eukprot:TRINITY_DN70142_c0_g1_i1.p1 TRINITY_DN70142_c0_g1~~TRINITY_DN70142_c0_g1_i1.p1  ORF type:complete len:261 (+),score=40.33 TRINITY_DN70142_c0_g1_i1:63-845(+)
MGCRPSQPPPIVSLVDEVVDADGRSSIVKAGPPWSWTGRVIFVRHAQAMASKERSAENRRDPWLSDTGTDQARRLAERLCCEESSLDVICSPMRRCLLTATPLVAAADELDVECPLNGQRAVCHALFCEHGNDPCAFKARSIAASFPALFGGTELQHEVEFESFDSCDALLSADTRCRAVEAAAWLRSYAEERGEIARTIAVFCHQTFMDCLLQVLIDGSAKDWEYGSPVYKFHNTGVTEVRCESSGVTVVRKNDIQHLK